MAWRDYWQQLWIVHGDKINSDLKNEQTSVENFQIPAAIVNANTGISVVDNAINELYQTGYMHNHMRMYIASICCNIAHSHWHEPAKWMYYHLLDGDVASNQLSWQWVAGSNSKKKYYANQDNINKYFHDNQKNTFLDIDYEDFDTLSTPTVLSELTTFSPTTNLSTATNPELDASNTTLIYNYYNLDPEWHKGEDVQRVLLLEPSTFGKYPVSRKCIDFAIGLSKNIEGIKIWAGEFDELKRIISHNIRFKEHPLNKHYQGTEESREWLTSITGNYPSFFAFWKRCKKELRW